MPLGKSVPLPHRNVENTSEPPSGLTFATNPSVKPAIEISGQDSVRNAPGVVGKSTEEVLPVT
jgi:hypothetical protein